MTVQAESYVRGLMEKVSPDARAETPKRTVEYYEAVSGQGTNTSHLSQQVRQLEQSANLPTEPAVADLEITNMAVS